MDITQKEGKTKEKEKEKDRRFNVFVNEAKQGCLSHLLIHGPAGSGKKTYVRNLIDSAYSAESHAEIFTFSKMNCLNKESTQSFEASTLMCCPIVRSSYHVEVNPSDLGVKDANIIQTLIVELASHRQEGNGLLIIVIHDADLLTKLAHEGLRRVVEKYSVNCRFILIVENVCKLHRAIRSRFESVRISAPSINEIKCTLSIEYPKCNVVGTIARICCRNWTIARALASATIIDDENTKKEENVFSDNNNNNNNNNDDILTMEDIIAHLCALFSCKTISNILNTEIRCLEEIRKLRKPLHSLFIKGTPPAFFLKILQQRCQWYDPRRACQIIAHWEHQIVNGSVESFYLDSLFLELLQDKFNNNNKQTNKNSNAYKSSEKKQ